MPYPPILRDAHGNPIPVVWDDSINNWRVLKGFEHGQQMRLLDKNGNPISSENPLPVNGQVTLTDHDGQPISSSNRLPVDAALSGTVDVSDNAERELGKVTLTGSNLALRNTIVTGAKTVTSTAAEVFAGASRLSGRHAMVITNTGNNTVYIGASTVSASNGFPVFPQDTIRIEFDPQSSVAVFAVSDGPNVEVRVVELA